MSKSFSTQPLKHLHHCIYVTKPCLLITCVMDISYGALFFYTLQVWLRVSIQLKKSKSMETVYLNRKPPTTVKQPIPLNYYIYTTPNQCEKKQTFFFYQICKNLTVLTWKQIRRTLTVSLGSPVEIKPRCCVVGL